MTEGTPDIRLRTLDGIRRKGGFTVRGCIEEILSNIPPYFY